MTTVLIHFLLVELATAQEVTMLIVNFTNEGSKRTNPVPWESHELHFQDDMMGEQVCELRQRLLQLWRQKNPDQDESRGVVFCVDGIIVEETSDELTFAEAGILSHSNLHVVQQRSIIGSTNFFVHLHGLTGQSYSVELSSVFFPCLVLKLKAAQLLKGVSLENLRHLPLDSVRLIFAGKQLEDFRRIADYCIQTGSKIHVIFR